MSPYPLPSTLSHYFALVYEGGETGELAIYERGKCRGIMSVVICNTHFWGLLFGESVSPLFVVKAKAVILCIRGGPNCVVEFLLFAVFVKYQLREGVRPLFPLSVSWFHCRFLLHFEKIKVVLPVTANHTNLSHGICLWDRHPKNA